eukprot:TRINITY_DN207_c2_g1_i3.p1 TRINITY_DN207_c2_g1~~TRINITY_DN207_c2_g1_i3.p1  ORF type:complete len:347 (+),score=125.10 TRINITY_DN207_c2_g1_i3:86-1126(+)
MSLANLAWTASLVPPNILAVATRKHMAPETALLLLVLSLLRAVKRRWGGAEWAAAAAAAWLLFQRRAKVPKLPSGVRRAILVTGAASGIGLETAKLFHARGWFVGMYDLNLSALPAAAQAVGANVCTGQLDVCSQESCIAAVQDFVQKTGGRLDCLFNCAGLLKVCDFAAEPIENQLKQVEVNVVGVVRMTHAAHPSLKKTPGARVVTMASLASVIPAPRFTVYNMTKGAVAQMTESLQVEFDIDDDDIVATDVAVGFVRTPMVTGQSRIAEKEAAGKKTALTDSSTMVTADLVAQAVWRAAHGARGKIHYQADAAVGVIWRLAGLDRMLELGILQGFARNLGAVM